MYSHHPSLYMYILLTYTPIGIALRISLTQGLHHDCEMERQDPKLCARRQSIWWTLYILDRRFSALMGAPVSIHDEDITLGLPNPDHAMQKCGALSIHVRLSRLMSILLSSRCSCLSPPLFEVDLTILQLYTVQTVDLIRRLPAAFSKFSAAWRTLLQS